MNPYSIGYVGLDVAKVFGIPSAMIQNYAGNFVYPSVAGVQAAMDDFSTEAAARANNGSINLFTNIFDPRNVTDGYPIATITYIAFDETRLVAQDPSCTALKDVVYLVYWMFSDVGASATATASYFMALSTGMRAAILTSLSNLNPPGCTDYSPYPFGKGILNAVIDKWNWPPPPPTVAFNFIPIVGGFVGGTVGLLCMIVFCQYYLAWYVPSETGCPDASGSHF